MYIVFISTNIKGVVDYYTETDRDVRFYMAALLPFLIAFSLVRNLKFLAPFSMIANILIATGMGITFYYIFSDLPSISDLPNFSSWSQLPLFFGTAIFALEGIGVVSTIDESRSNPRKFPLFLFSSFLCQFLSISVNFCEFRRTSTKNGSLTLLVRVLRKVDDILIKLWS